MSYRLFFTRWTILSCLILLTSTSNITAQSRRDVWRMGYWQSGPTFQMNFYGGVLQIDSITAPNPMSMDITDASISDLNGNILFYTNGIYIANDLHDTMLNGGNLNPSPATAMSRDHGMPSFQGAIVLPDPLDSMQYYLFYLSVNLSNNLRGDTLFMAKVDMRLDGGLGGVTIKNYPLSTLGFMCGQLMACKHANGRDWWLVTHGFNNDTYYKFLISPYGISSPSSQNIGIISAYPGQACFSPDGSKYASFASNYDVELFNFDRCTGDFSNYNHIVIPDSSVTAGCSFSPNSNVLYVSSKIYLYQMDVTAPDITATLDTVAIWDGFGDPVPTTFFFQQLAPDNKIYITGWGSVNHLSVINFPDSLGNSCNVSQHSIALPGNNNGSFPNYPFYELGALGGSVCDSLPTGIYVYNNNEVDIHVFPNPAKNKIYLKYPNKKINEIEIVNALGKTVSANAIINNSSYIEIEVSDLASGIYFLTIKTNQSSQTTNFIKE